MLGLVGHGKGLGFCSEMALEHFEQRKARICFAFYKVHSSYRVDTRHI